MPFTNATGISPTRSIKTPYSPLISDQGDLIIGGQYGLPQRLPKGGPGQVLGVNPDGSVGYFTFQGGFSNPMTAQGDMIIGGPGGTPQKLSIGLNGKYLSVVAGVPSWVDVQALPIMVGHAGKFLTTDGSTAKWEWVIPSQTGNTGKFLTTNGTVTSWATVDALPVQGGQAGKFLTTDGSSASWAVPPSGFANPMTTQWDIIVGGTGGSAQRMPISTQKGDILGVKQDGTLGYFSFSAISPLPAVGSGSGKILSSNGSAFIWIDPASSLPAQAGQAGKVLTTDGSQASWMDNPVPSVSGQSGKVLTTDGTRALWAPAAQTALPQQAGQNGKYLTTNGTEAFWGPALNPVMGSVQVVINNQPATGGAMPSAGFTSKGGPLMIFVSGACYAKAERSKVTIGIMVDGVKVGGVTKWLNSYGLHTPISGEATLTGLPAGPHTLTFSLEDQAGADDNDFFSATITEYNPVDGGWTFFSPDTPFKTPSGMDDEFEKSDIEPFWIPNPFWNKGKHSYSVNRGVLNCVLAGNSPNQMAATLQPIPTGDFTMWTKVTTTNPGGQWVIPGMVISDGSSNKQTYFGIHKTQGKLIIQTIGNWGETYVSSLGEPVWALDYAYLRIKKVGVNFIFGASSDGIMWDDFASDPLSALAPTHIGLSMYNYTAAYRCNFQFFRVSKTTDVLGEWRTIGSGGGGGTANFPPQDGHAGEFLQTDGKDVKWAKASGLPEQTGHANQWLTTDGTDATWKTLPGTGGDQGVRILGNFPQGIMGPALGVVDGTLVVVGGMQGSTAASTKAWKWNETTREFTLWTNLPEGYSYGGYCQDPVTQTIYLFGSRSGGGSTYGKSAMSLTRTGLAAKIPDLPGNPRGPMAAWLTKGPNAGCAMVAGGYDGSRVTRCDLYNPKTNAWTTMPAMPLGINEGHMVTITGGPFDGHVLTLGGWQTQGVVQKYDPIVGTWSTMLPFPNPGGDTGHIFGAAALPGGYVLIHTLVDGKLRISNPYLTQWNDVPGWSFTGSMPMVAREGFCWMGGGALATGPILSDTTLWRSGFYTRDFNALMSQYTSLLNPMTQKGDMIIGAEGGSPAKLPKGQAGQILGIDKQGEIQYLDPNKGIYGISAPGVYQEWDVNVPPAAYNPLDEEFRNGDLGSKWAKVNWDQLDSWDIGKTRPDQLTMVGNNKGRTLCALLQPLPVGDFTVFLKGDVPTGPNSHMGIVLSDTNASGSGNQVVTATGLSGGTWDTWSYYWSGFNTLGGILGTRPPGRAYYLKVSREGSVYTTSSSVDGLTWALIYKGPLSFTPTYFGLDSQYDTTGVGVTSVDFLRYSPNPNAPLGRYIWKGNSLYNPMRSANELIVGGMDGAAIRLESGKPGQILGVKPDGNVGFVDYFGANAIEIQKGKSVLYNGRSLNRTSPSWAGYTTAAKVGGDSINWAVSKIVPVMNFIGTVTIGAGFCYRVAKDTMGVLEVLPLTLNGSTSFSLGNNVPTKLDPIKIQFGSEFDYWFLMNVTSGTGDYAPGYNGEGGGGWQGAIATSALTTIPTPGTSLAGTRVALYDVLLAEVPTFLPGAQLQGLATQIWDNTLVGNAITGSPFSTNGGPLEFKIHVQAFASSAGVTGYTLLANDTILGEIKQYINEGLSHKSMSNTMLAQLPRGAYSLRLVPLGSAHRYNDSDFCSLVVTEYAPTSGTRFSQYQIDMAPDTPSKLDDEFTNPVLDKWTRVNMDQDTPWDIGTTKPGALTLKPLAKAQPAIRALMQELPPGDFVAYVKMGCETPGTTSTKWAHGGLVLSSQATSGKQAWICAGNYDKPIRAGTLYNGFNTLESTFMDSRVGSANYLMVKRISGNYTAGWSLDGSTWETAPFTPAEPMNFIGVGVDSISPKQTFFMFEFFRLFQNPNSVLGNWSIQGKEVDIIKNQGDIIVGDTSGKPVRLPRGGSGMALKVLDDGSLGWGKVATDPGTGSGGSGGGNVYYTEDFALDMSDGAKTRIPLNGPVPVEDLHEVVRVAKKSPQGTIVPLTPTLIKNYSTTPVENWSNGVDFSVVIDPNVTSPDGTKGAVAKCSTTSKSGRFHGSVTTQEAGTYTHSIWLKADTPCQIWFSTNNGLSWGSGNAIICNITTEWKQFSFKSPNGMQWQILSSANASRPDVDPAYGLPPATFYAWGGMVEAGATPHFPVPAGTTVTSEYSIDGTTIVLVNPLPMNWQLLWTGFYASGVGSIPNNRADFSTLASELPAGAGVIQTLDACKTAQLISVKANCACRVRVHGTLAQAQKDFPRPATKDPEGNHGLLAEVVLTGPMTWEMSPSSTLYNLDNPTVPKWYVTINNLEATAKNVEVVLGVLKMETGITSTINTTLPALTGNSGKFLTNDGASTLAWATVDALPAQKDQSGKFLTTDGASASWATVKALPDQAGKAGRFLKTDGTSASWEDAQITPNGSIFKVGDGTKTTFTLEHNLGTEDLNVSFWKGSNLVFVPARTDGVNKLVVEFQNPPALNEIKVVIQGLNNSTVIPAPYQDIYSTTETLTNKVWIDGKPIYRKVVGLGALPNNTTKTVPHGITGVAVFTSVQGMANSGGYSLPLPYTHPTSSNNIGLWTDHSTGTISVITGYDRSSYIGQVFLEYTKA